MNATPKALFACLVVLLLVAIALAPSPGARDPFYTEHGQEEPTRSYVPYTGTVPYGHWGATPWAEMVPRGGFPRWDPRHCASHSG